MSGTLIELVLDDALGIVYDQLQNIDESDCDRYQYGKVACLAFAGRAIQEMRDEYFEGIPDWVHDLEDAIADESVAVSANALLHACASLAENELDCINERIPSIIDDLRESLADDEED